MKTHHGETRKFERLLDEAAVFYCEDCGKGVTIPMPDALTVLKKVNGDFHCPNCDTTCTWMPIIATEAERIEEAYLRMACEIGYRPAAAGASLTDAELRDESRLRREAELYAQQFIREENSLDFHIGVSNWSTNRAFVFVIEAARRLCGAEDKIALQLLSMAVAEVKGDESAGDPDGE